MSWNDTQVLVTGGLGFIGSNLAHKLVDRGADVHLLDACLPEYGSNPANIAGIRNDVTVTEADVRERSAIEEAVQSSDIVFHLAAQLSRTISNEHPATDASINCEGFLNVLDAAESAECSPRVVFASSQAVVGAPPSIPFDEETPAAPLDVYGANKRAGEHYCRIFDRSRGVSALSVRLTNVYGPRAQLSNPDYGVINNFIASALRDESLTVFEPGTIKRDFLHVSDVVDGLLHLGQDHDHYGEEFVLGSGRAIMIKDLAHIIVDSAGAGTVELVPWPDDWDSIRVGDLQADPSKMADTFDWSSSVALEPGIEETISYYQKYEDQYI